MTHASNSHTADSFDHAQHRRAAQAMVLASAWNALVSATLWVVEYIAERRRVAHTIAALEGLSDRTLADIGLSRSDIGRVARKGRDVIGD